MAKKFKKRYTVLVVILVIFIAGTAFITHNVLPYAVISRQKRTVTTPPSQYDLKVEAASFQLTDSTQLKGYYTYPKDSIPKGIIIFLHGIGGAKEHFYELSKTLNEKNIATVVYDARAHGKSDGQYITYGYYEKYDVQVIVDSIKQKHPELPIGIWGNSMGGAVAIQALAVEPRIDFGIIESTFTDLEQIVYDYQKRYTLGIGLRFISDYSLKRAGEIAQFDPSQVMPIEAVQHIEQPMFIAHGTADPNIKFEYGQQLFEKLKSKNKTFYPVEGANHYNLFQVGKAPYEQAIWGFMLDNIEAN